ncbi:hypothetical protein E5K00_16110 [Hymenobacter aquaticus]|uniref:BZIP transcription factor n=1 Tax=Hymenobacter aquaticus TaxID=1867101 RepID=A0A4Z0PWU1_9BACT|nr:hypothetical protein E5K00_16110 [Hymenobacter aquaticus]
MLTVAGTAQAQNQNVLGNLNVLGDGSHPNTGDVSVNGALLLTGSNYWVFQTPNDGRTDMYVAPNWNWNSETRFQSNGDVVFSGKVTIGRTGINPGGAGSLRLAVEGPFGAHAVYVRAPGVAWPDYVFAPAYRLRPLPDVEQFILVNRHLPDVPAATEVEKQGLDLAATDAVLLRKVEELTLYLIALQKENDALKARVGALERKR